MVKPSRRSSESGQAIIEYILLLSIIVTAYMTVFQWLNRLGLGDRLARPLTHTYAKTYKYGHPEASGMDDGGPNKHPVMGTSTGGSEAQGGRMFINPR